MAMGAGGLMLVIALLMVMVYIGTMSGRKKMRQRQNRLSQTSSQPPAEGAPLDWRTLERGDNDLLCFFLADRCIAPVAGTASLTATWTGGSYLSEVAYAIYRQGYLWAHMPFGYGLALIIGGRFFAARIRQQEYITMLDVFHDHVGKYAPAFFIWPAVFCELLWSVTVLRSAGFAFNDIANVKTFLAIWFVVVTALTYSTLGGYYTVVYNGTVQMIACSAMLWTCVPFLLSRSAVGTLNGTDVSMLGTISPVEVISVIDIVGATALGGIVRQEFFQSVLSSERVVTAKLSSYASGIACFLVALPSVIAGGAARTTNFTTIDATEPARIVGPEAPYRLLPHALGNLTPLVLAPVILAALASSVLASFSSSCMAVGSMVTHNVYHALLRPTAQEREVSLVMRVSMIVSGVASVILTLVVKQTNELLLLSADVAYVTLFPQLVCAFYMPSRSNPYGCVAGFAVAVLLRVLCGLPVLGVPVTLALPFYDEERSEQRFPFRTFCMLGSLGAIVATSKVFSTLINAGLISDVIGHEPVAIPVKLGPRHRPSAAVVSPAVLSPPETATQVPGPSTIDSVNKQTATSVDTDVPTRHNTNTSGNEETHRPAKEPVTPQVGDRTRRKGGTPKHTTRKRTSTAPSPEHTKLHKKRIVVPASPALEAVSEIATKRVSNL